ncbi:hypothetical protein AB990_17055 [Alkalihalobacillus pseudalcaliphilus]|nr:hypothetical protein AB990_17055 [Alkalihalobacillus pseudalcaliphilus]
MLILVALEGILAADHALVITTIVKHLPDKQRKKALFYGLAGAFVFRFASLFLISYLVHIWQHRTFLILLQKMKFECRRASTYKTFNKIIKVAVINLDLSGFLIEFS